MSADLFAAFGDPPPAAGAQDEQGKRKGPTTVQASSQYDTRSAQKPLPHGQQQEENLEQDDWGAFESFRPQGSTAETQDQASSSTGLGPLAVPEGGHDQDGTFAPLDDGDTDAWGDFETYAPPARQGVSVGIDVDAGLETAPGTALSMDPGRWDGLGFEEKSETSTTWHQPWRDPDTGTGSQDCTPPSLKERQGERRPEPRAQKTRDEDVLFDAEEEMEGAEHHGAMDDDDFGDFETAAADTTSAPWHEREAALLEPRRLGQSGISDMTSNLDLLSLESGADPTPPGPRTGARTQTSERVNKPLQAERGPSLLDDISASSDLGVTEAKEEVEDFDDWDTFDDPSTVTTTSKARSGAPKDPADVPTSSSFVRNEAPATASPSSPAPTNIPPPSLLLSLFPHLLTSFLTTSPLFTPGPASLKARVQDSPSITIPPLQQHVSHLTTLSYILAGRSLRWKRDTHLSQSIRIGPAVSSRGSGGGGMKLTPVSRGESIQEEREVAEVVSIFQDQVGRLRAAVGAVRAVQPSTTLPGVPDVAAAAATRKDTVHTVSAAEGGVKAEGSRQCALCGLKREERVRNVDNVGDARVEDSFGEWWVEFWGHRACMEFWDGNRGRLGQR